MAKTKEELKELKEEYKTLTNKLKELSDEELSIVTGGVGAEDHNIFLTGSFKENSSNSSGGGIYNEGKL